MQVDRDIVAVGLADMQVITNEGEILPIVNMFDEFGDETSNEVDAVALVAGPDKIGEWWSINLEDYISNVGH